MTQSSFVTAALTQAFHLAEKLRQEYVTPEHLLYVIMQQKPFHESASDVNIDIQPLLQALALQIEQQERIPDGLKVKQTPSAQLARIFGLAEQMVRNAGVDQLECTHLIFSIMQLPHSLAADILKENFSDETHEDFSSNLISAYEFYEAEGIDVDLDEEDNEPSWHHQVTCLSNEPDKYVLFGRDVEMQRIIQVMSRKNKNNPLLLGEPGVGKTALVHGLALHLKDAKKVGKLVDCTIYELDLASIMASAQFRGDMERRLKSILEGARSEGNVILYIDDIHNLIGAGGGEGSMDAGNVIKPYLEDGSIRFIGSTTYEEYNRYFSKNKGLVRRFQQIDIPEPSIEETIEIITKLSKSFEKYHDVKFKKGVLEEVVKLSARYISDRFLPDKAIDLMDETATFCKMQAMETGKKTVTMDMLTQVLGRICKIDANILKEANNQELKTLSKRMLSKIYGQDMAVNQLVEAVQMAKAGLSDDEKPMACLLFVGPTGVGKTEVAKVLAYELGINLVRFDMSEYSERHTVAKLIGSPAGYVGYDDGGLLTDAIRKSPNCVLLLDEIEKAHPDVFNILLQVMDYAKLTDSKGNKADFRHVILIMTSNAGAQFANQASVGFASQVTAGDAMMKQVKKIFKPEFLNRLSGTLVFNDMDRTMASMILDKKLRQLQTKLTAKNVVLNLSEEAHNYLLEIGFNKEYGAREMDRILQQNLNRLLMQEILFGKLKKGGTADVKLVNGSLTL